MLYGKEFSDKQHMRDLMLGIAKNKLFGKTDLFSRDILAGVAKNEIIDDRKFGKVSTSMGGGWSTTPKYILCYKNKTTFSDTCNIEVYVHRQTPPSLAGQPRHTNYGNSNDCLEALKLSIHYNKEFGYLSTGFNLNLYSDVIVLDATNDTVAKAIDTAFEQIMTDRQQQAYNAVQTFRKRVQTIRQIFDATIS